MKLFACIVYTYVYVYISVCVLVAINLKAIWLASSDESVNNLDL